MAIAPSFSATPAQFRRFLVTGIVNTGIHTFVAVTLITSGAASPTFANVVAFTTATVVSYVLNTRWSFTRPMSRKTLLRFAIVSVFCVLVAGAVAKTADSLGAHYLFGIVCVAIVVAPTSFTLHKFWTYRE